MKKTARFCSLLLVLVLLAGAFSVSAYAKKPYTVYRLDAPTDVTLELPCADEAAVIENLRSNASVDASNGIKSLQIAWCLPENAVYNAAPGAVNTFCWTAEKNKDYDFSAVVASGTILVTNHSHVWREDGTYPRTTLSCTEAQTFWKSCVCGTVSDTVYYETAAAAGHSWSEWEWRSAKADARTCSVCGEAETRQYPAFEILNRLLRYLVKAVIAALKQISG